MWPKHNVLAPPVGGRRAVFTGEPGQKKKVEDDGGHRAAGRRDKAETRGQDCAGRPADGGGSRQEGEEGMGRGSGLRLVDF